ncbi:MAG: hypothetical protein IJK67_02830 [Bacilli bacterium]|nr:hypothetical protein [Bacilli bacterium]
MADIKVRDVAKKGVKTINKAVVQTERFKDTIVRTKEKAEESVSNDISSNEYASNKVMFATNRAVDEGVHQFNKQGQKSLMKTKENYQKSKAKIKAFKKKMQSKSKAKSTVKNTKTAIKTSKEVAKKAEKTAKETVKASKRAAQIAKETAKRTAQGIKLAVKATISAIKAIIAGTKALIAAIVAGGWVAVVVIIVICLVALLVGSIFGIFFSSEKTSANAVTMNEVVAECNQEFADKIQEIQNTKEHDDYVLDGSMASWKDILLVYTIKQSNGKNETDVVTMDDSKKKVLKDIFWDMNSLSSEVKEETVTERGVNTSEEPKEVQKKVLHIKITSKSVEDMKSQYNFNTAQNNQLAELSSDKYASLWSGVIYGSNGSGEYVNWRQGDPSWSNVRIGNTSSTVGRIGCLVTSIAILIEKSGANTIISPFNPGTFVEALNKNGGFDGDGNLQYAAVSKAVPGFKYVGNVNLRGKSRSEKLATISQYFSQGYYLTAEVKGATQGSQHWVAITGVDSVNVMMVDPATDQTIMWNAYEVGKTTQFNYFKAE